MKKLILILALSIGLFSCTDDYEDTIEVVKLDCTYTETTRTENGYFTVPEYGEWLPEVAPSNTATFVQTRSVTETTTETESVITTYTPNNFTCENKAPTRVHSQIGSTTAISELTRIATNSNYVANQENTEEEEVMAELIPSNFRYDYVLGGNTNAFEFTNHSQYTDDELTVYYRIVGPNEKEWAVFRGSHTTNLWGQYAEFPISAPGGNYIEMYAELNNGRKTAIASATWLTQEEYRSLTDMEIEYEIQEDGVKVEFELINNTGGILAPTSHYFTIWRLHQNYPSNQSACALYSTLRREKGVPGHAGTIGEFKFYFDGKTLDTVHDHYGTNCPIPTQGEKMKIQSGDYEIVFTF